MSMAGYTKLFNSILASTIWRAPNTTRIVWITMLAMADKDGIVEGSIPGLADFARVTVDECRAALSELSSPDPDSRTEDYDGRRIEAIGGTGWRLLNHGKYRAKMSEDERREYNRQKQTEWRARKKLSNVVIDSQSQSAMSAQAEAQADSEAEAQAFVPSQDAHLADGATATKSKKVKFLPPTIEALKLYAEKIGLSEMEALKFHAYFDATGWRISQGKRPMISWEKSLKNWQLQSGRYENRHGNSGSGRPTAADIRNSRISGAEEIRERTEREWAEQLADPEGHHASFCGPLPQPPGVGVVPPPPAKP